MQYLTIIPHFLICDIFSIMKKRGNFWLTHLSTKMVEYTNDAT